MAGSSQIQPGGSVDSTGVLLLRGHLLRLPAKLRECLVAKNGRSPLFHPLGLAIGRKCVVNPLIKFRPRDFLTAIPIPCLT